MSNNNQPEELEMPETVEFTIEQRIELIANLLYDRIKKDQAEGEVLLKRILEDKQ